MAIDKKTVEYVAHLARIELTPKELDKLSGQLEEIVSFIDQLKQADISDIPATSHILPQANIMRLDEPRAPLEASRALSNAPQKEGGFFIVPKVID